MEKELPACPVETTLMLISDRWKVLICQNKIYLQKFLTNEHDKLKKAHRYTLVTIAQYCAYFTHR